MFQYLSSSVKGNFYQCRPCIICCHDINDKKCFPNSGLFDSWRPAASQSCSILVLAEEIKHPNFMILGQKWQKVYNFAWTYPGGYTLILEGVPKIGPSVAMETACFHSNGWWNFLARLLLIYVSRLSSCKVINFLPLLPKSDRYLPCYDRAQKWIGLDFDQFLSLRWYEVNGSVLFWQWWAKKGCKMLPSGGFWCEIVC